MLQQLSDKTEAFATRQQRELGKTSTLRRFFFPFSPHDLGLATKVFQGYEGKSKFSVGVRWIKQVFSLAHRKHRATAVDDLASLIRQVTQAEEEES